MKAQLNLFNKSINSTISGSAILDKVVLKKRIKNTHFYAANKSFTVNKWITGDEQLPMFYTVEKTSLGELLIAATSKGITYLGFIVKSRAATIADLKRRFPGNSILEGITELHTAAITRINNPANELRIHLHLKGTEFQLGVWKKLLLIPFGGVINYSQLGSSNSDSRAVGAAVGANPVGYLVPCHRVIRSDGSFNGFFWGNDVKAHLLTYEATCEIN